MLATREEGRRMSEGEGKSREMVDKIWR